MSRLQRFLFAFAVIGLACCVGSETKPPRVLDFADIPPPWRGIVDPEWVDAINARKFRIAPLDLELTQRMPELDDIVLDPTCPAFRYPIKGLAIVRLEDRHCWGVLCVSTDKSWAKVRFGSYIPVLTVNAVVEK